MVTRSSAEQLIAQRRGESLVLLARHGETIKPKGTLAAWLNYPLSHKGQQQAKQLAWYLSGWEIDKIYCSDLTRTHDTAAAIALHHPSAEFIPTMELRAWNQGHLEGRVHKEVNPEIQYYVDHPTVSAPGGEAYHTFALRLLGFFNSIVHEIEKSHITPLLVTHSECVSAALKWMHEGFHSVDPRIMADHEDQLGLGGLLLVRLRGERITTEVLIEGSS